MRYLKKTMSAAADILFGAMLVIGIALIVMRVCGYKLLAVETGSMGEAYPVGSLVIAESCDPEEIREGDVITFVANEDLLTVTHRVTEVDEKNRRFYTKGDANNAPDGSPVAFENLVGKVRAKIPYLGYAVIWAHTLRGKIVIALALSLTAVCVAGGVTYKNMKQEKERENEQSDKQEEAE